MSELTSKCGDAELPIPDAPDGPCRLDLRIGGVVQGVGFRPHVYRLAGQLALTGWVRNEPEGVAIQVQGPAARCRAFAEQLSRQPPGLARIDRFEMARVAALEGEQAFEIRPSGGLRSAAVLISPDVALCPQCRRELNDPADPRFGHPFINCTDCGPRYSIVRGVPYDRARTTMARFAACGRCAEEYTDPGCRRFHAQPVCCPECGPHLLWFEEGADEPAVPGRARDAELIRRAAQRVAAGGVLALKGLGGYHLACDASSEAAVRRLRARKRREEKPLAVMFRDLAALSAAVELTDAERALLESPAAPVVLCRKRPGLRIALSVAPGSARLGVFLPYTPLHALLLSQPEAPTAWVMTSGNLCEEPIACDDSDAQARLGRLADAILYHDRPIHTRVDDSVMRCVDGRPRFVRRARGYVPLPLRLPRVSGRCVLAAGADLKNALCLTRGAEAFLSQHLGDLENNLAQEGFRHTAELLALVLQVRPDLAVCDLHPEYYSTRYVREDSGLPCVEVQHHHAHAAALLAEHGLAGPALVWCCDGTGYGLDGTTWGCELLLADLRGFVRLASLRPALLPGGDLAVRRPWRQALARLAELGAPGEAARRATALGLLPAGTTAADVSLLLEQITKRVACPPSSGLGRLFDSVAALLGIQTENHFEGQAPMRLEDAAATAAVPADLPPFEEYPSEDVRQSDHAEGLAASASAWRALDPVRLDARGMLANLVEQRLARVSSAGLALGFHLRLAEALARAAVRAAETLGIRTVGLSGGCFLNEILETQLSAHLRRAGLEVLVHRALPPNDGCIALGQAACAHARMEDH